ncbi:GLPGLI family protein [Tenacibaculum aquimarinum]|uniref:GLPGLI family protein n=1 Tax=Tenacibaculum aquimarinum TaxID=2910675 RepID=UPI001F0A2AFD|nr:GLPGLI family protein [Tenacibaculum aquimarinum]MCH3884420.1 GLPGLI family protein [Tenacibaculum aquimarinum]
MKKILLLTFLFCCLHTYSQATKIIYSVKLHNTKNSSKKMILDCIKIAETMNFSLIFNEKNSYSERLNISSLETLETKTTSVLVGYYSSWYQDVDLNSSYIRSIKFIPYEIDYKKKMLGWKKTNETKEIIGYTCYKAIRKEFNKRSGKDIYYTAWYTKDIPQPFGPAGSGGLEGVILELHKGKVSSHFAKYIEFNTNTNSISKTPVGIKKISPEESVYLSKKARGEID